jgi:hypothetical protein
MDLPGNGLRGQGVVAGDHLDPDAGAATGLDGLGGTRAWRIHHGLKPQKHKTFGTLGLFDALIVFESRGLGQDQLWRCGMVRTQICLTERQRDELTAMAKKMGKKQSELIREAIDRLIDQLGNRQRDAVLRETAGIWKDRQGLPDFEAARAGWDRQ